MDFLGNIYLGIRVIDWIILLMLFFLFGRTTILSNQIAHYGTKVENLWKKLYWDEKYPPEDRYEPTETEYENLDYIDKEEIEPVTPIKEQEKENNKKVILKSQYPMFAKVFWSLIGLFVLVIIVGALSSP